MAHGTEWRRGRIGSGYVGPAALVLIVLALLAPTAAARGDDAIHVVILGGRSAVSEAVAEHIAACTSSVPVRRAGTDRYATAASVSQATFPDTASVVYVATGENYPDAASAGPPAALEPGPILLVKQDSIPETTASELVRLGASTIYVIGGETAISRSVVSSLSSYGDVVRLAGTDRYATAAVVSNDRIPQADVAFVASGENFPDALTGTVAATAADAPILLVRRGEVPVETATELDRIAPAKIVLLGGPGAVSAAVEVNLASHAQEVTRLSGSNRYGTAAAISAATFPAGSNTFFVAAGTDFPDALVGGAAAGTLNAPLLLVTKYRVPTETAAEISRLTGTPCSPADLTPSLTVLTDSVVLGAERYIPGGFPGWAVEVLGHPALMLHQAEDAYLPPGKVVGTRVAVGLGYNSLWERDRVNYDKWAAKFDREADALIDAILAHGARTIAWITLREPYESALETQKQRDQFAKYGWYFLYVNERIRLLPDRHPEVVIADWATVSHGPGPTSDLIHLNRTGKLLMTDVLRSTLNP